MAFFVAGTSRSSEQAAKLPNSKPVKPPALLHSPYLIESFLSLPVFAPALLLLMFSSPMWHVGQSLPVMGTGPMTDSCVFHARSLLEKITDALTQTDLFSGIDCSKQNMELNMETSTSSVCVPKRSKCSEITPPKFNQHTCLTSIGKDLLHYYDLLSVLTPTVQSSLRELMENCFAWSLPKGFPVLKEAAPDRLSTYDERLSHCKVLRGFQVRTITINRAISYINSGEHNE
ncbi:interleukin-12 subunit alpha [Genypterus blacodes]|uniref:interleukin-12 subunit alpha n=1 Tax=Genypterus blacodes TaxID=154954 RepID=UPI003F75AB86